MYTEIKELVNFIATYLFAKIPRRTVSLFTEQLANFLVSRFLEHTWDLENPSKDEQHRVLQLKYRVRTDQFILSSAQAVGLEVDEVLGCLPENLLLFANPCEVFYRGSENSTAVPIWMGEKGVDPDINYCPLPASVVNPQDVLPTGIQTNMGAAGRTVYIGRGRKNDAGGSLELDDAYVPLNLEPLRTSSSDDNPLLSKGTNVKMFVYTPKEHVMYTVQEFSVTRFGSHRQRPDHDVMRRIQKQAAFKAISGSSQAGYLHQVGVGRMDGSGDGQSAMDRPHTVYHRERSNYIDQSTFPTGSEALLTLNPGQKEALLNFFRHHAPHINPSALMDLQTLCAPTQIRPLVMCPSSGSETIQPTVSTEQYCMGDYACNQYNPDHNYSLRPNLNLDLGISKRHSWAAPSGWGN